MAKKIIIFVPDDATVSDIADYVHVVADQIHEGYLGGHLSVDHYWESEGRLS